MLGRLHERFDPRGNGNIIPFRLAYYIEKRFMFREEFGGKQVLQGRGKGERSFGTCIVDQSELGKSKVGKIGELSDQRDKVVDRAKTATHQGKNFDVLLVIPDGLTCTLIEMCILQVQGSETRESVQILTKEPGIKLGIDAEGGNFARERADASKHRISGFVVFRSV